MSLKRSKRDSPASSQQAGKHRGLSFEPLERRAMFAGFSLADFGDVSGLTLSDDAAVTADNALRVAPAVTESRGSVWFTEKQFVSVGFETTFDFRMAGGGRNGMAFVVQNESAAALGRNDPGMGYKMIRNSLAVEFDTALSTNQGDPNDNHVSVQTGGTDYNDQNIQYSLGFASPPFDLNDGAVHTAKIIYVPGTLSVYVDDLANPLLTVSADLSATLDLDLGRAWVGFTAQSADQDSTVLTWQDHDVLNWEYRTLVDTTEAIGISNARQAEGNGGTSDITFVISRLGDSSGSATVSWATADGTATTADYAPGSGQVTFAPGDLEKTINVTVVSDTAQEANETFLVNLALDSGSAVLTDRQAVGTILNDDVTMSIGDATAIEGNQAWRYIDDFVPAPSTTLVSPRYTIIGPDGNLYVGSRTSDDVHRFDGQTGAFIDVFTKTVPGFLDDPRGLVFGPDGHLYVGSADNRVLRFNGTTGDYIDDFVSQGAAGLDRAEGLAFGPDGHLYVSDRVNSRVLRFNGTTGAFLDVVVQPSSGGLNSATDILFGSDGKLYVSSAVPGAVLRYNGTTGAFIDAFVPTGSGGLKVTQGIEFGPDGDFYVCSLEGNEILRYNGLTGAFIEVVGSPSNSGLVRPQGLVFDANGMLYVSKEVVAGLHADDSVLRYGRRSVAVFTVSLSVPAGVPVTVNYFTGDGMAQAGTDFMPVSGTITFAPGETTRTILVQTLDDAVYEGNQTFVVNLSSPVGGLIANSQGVATIQDNESPPTKFYVVNDGSPDRTYEYSATGAAIENYAINNGNTAPRGAASTAAGDKTWVVDDNRKVYVYNNSGALVGSWTAGSLPNHAIVEGIATNGTDVWIVDSRSDRVHRYIGAASRLSGSQNAASSFALNSGNRDPMDIVTNGTHLWVVNDTTTDKVFKYTLSGSLVGSWTINSGGGSPTGITIDPSNVSDIWIVDNNTDCVYQYIAAASRTSGSQSPAVSFALASGNTNPQGIADPPAPAAVNEHDALRSGLPSSHHRKAIAKNLRAIDVLLATDDEIPSHRKQRVARAVDALLAP